MQFYTAGLDPSILNSDKLLNLSIDEGGDGYAIDFLTVGVTTVPGPASLGVLGALGIVAGAAL